LHLGKPKGGDCEFAMVESEEGEEGVTTDSSTGP
jgi:hypothetical protein